MKTKFNNSIKLVFTIMLLLASGCSAKSVNINGSITGSTNSANVIEEPTLTPPTETPLPPIISVATINQYGIPLSSFQASLVQFNLALMEYPNLLDFGENAEDKVLTDLFYRQLLAQGAFEAGYEVTADILLEKSNSITEQVGGEDSLWNWITNNGYSTKTEFLYDFGLEIAATVQKERIFDSVPLETEQTLAHQLFFHDAYLASRAFEQLSSGASWEVVRNSNDPFNYGYFGWFPKGYLLVPEIEKVAFSILPGAFSQVIESEIGYHIIYVIDRQEKILLAPDALLKLKNNALINWLDTEYQKSDITINLPEN